MVPENTGRKCRLLLVALLALSLTGCFTPSLVQSPLPLPEMGYTFYTGSEENAGDYYLAVVEMRHHAADRTVVLVSMLHAANQRFYRQVQEELDRADRVLTEGVWGAPSLSPGLFVMPYLIELYLREISYSGLARQSEGLVFRPNWRNADLSYGEFQNRMPWYTPFVQAVLMPPAAVFLESRNLYLWARDWVSTGLGMGEGFDALLRHNLARQIEDKDYEDENEDGGVILPGVIQERNQHLLRVFDRVWQEPGVARVAIPWGAGHMPGLYESLKARGYQETGRRWLRALSVRTLLEQGAESEDRAFDFLIPYLINWRSHDTNWSLALLCRSINLSFSESRYQMDILWDLLLSARGNPREQELQVLPAIFGRPLLFEWVRRGERTRVRFLLFFEIGSLSSPNLSTTE